MTELQPAVLPVTVTASHLRACAGELAGAGRVELGELTTMLEQVVAGQRLLAGALGSLAARVSEGHHSGALAAAPSADVEALADVLHAAADAFGCSAEALGESAPLATEIARTAGLDTRL
ncbi:hypothetical protein [Prauserella muralis]|uniref:hypothetical protein n=1 Tax=Prauserella muralis TaxID=588067 RepID=UPI000DD32EAF|nr:hypothetical protein [Prauserella muralis]TWE23230.1 hypothetical protein FHX69_4490 [Prauserella muralis]